MELSHLLHDISSLSGKEFTCKFCNRSFGSKHVLKNHELIHLFPYECTICCKRFTRYHHLQTHMVQHNLEEVAENSKVLDQLPKITSVQSCMYCEICGKVFPSSITLSHHYAKHFKHKLLADLPNKMPPYFCPVVDCPFETNNIKNWLRHYGIVHDQNTKYLKGYKKTGNTAENKVQDKQKRKIVDLPDENVNSNHNEFILEKINKVGPKTQKIKDDFIEELNQLVYPVNNPIQQNISELEYNDNDKLLDEHFKRSLGVDYEALFKKKPATSDSISIHTQISREDKTFFQRSTSDTMNK